MTICTVGQSRFLSHLWYSLEEGMLLVKRSQTKMGGRGEGFWGNGLEWCAEVAFGVWVVT